MSEPLTYFVDTTVPKYITAGIKEKMPVEVINLLFDLAFNRGSDFLHRKDEQLRPSYFQFFDITVTKDKLIIRHMQEQPDIDKTHEIEISNSLAVKKLRESTMRVYLIEDWNGTPKEVATREDHYITMLLPDEY